jgi:hypothetical protein
VVANPAGYLMNRGAVATSADFSFENPFFDRHLLLEVPS